MRRWAAALLGAVAAALWLQAHAADPSATTPASADPYPTPPYDACWSSINRPGAYIFFQAGTAEPYSAVRTAHTLDELAQSYRADGGIVLVEVHTDGAEAASGRSAALGDDRAAAIRRALGERGVPDHNI